ncbi:MAG: MFS transporter [Balneolales bacterium]|nr:MFS transporter [Balneolales bacterium]
MSTIQAGSPATPVIKNPNLHIIFCITLTAIMGVSSITPVLPMVATVFDISVGRAALLITIFTLPGMVLTPVLGMLADMIGRKKVLVPSLFLFGVAGFACSFAQTYEQLLWLRFMQGIGSAAIGALNVTMVGDLFSGNQRAEAMGYNSAVLSIGATIYPAVGGALAIIGWYAPFYLPLLAIPTGILVIFMLKNPEPGASPSFSRYILRVFNSLKNKRLMLLFAATMASFILLYGPLLTMLPFLMEERFTDSAFFIGLMLSAVSVSNGIASFNSGRLSRKFHPESLVKTSYVLYTSALLLIPFLPNIYWLVVPVLLYGVGQGLNLPVLITLIAGEARLENRGAIMSLNGMVIKISQTISPVLMSLIYFAGGFKGVYIVSSLLAMFFFILMYLLLKPASVGSANPNTLS